MANDGVNMRRMSEPEMIRRPDSTGPVPDKPLTLKQQRFVNEYLVDLNATRAYIRAGYSARGAHKLSARLMAHDGVRAALMKAVEAQSKRTGITADVILGELLLMARSDLAEAFDDAGNLKPINEIPEATRRAIASIEVDEITERGEGGKREVVGYTRKVKFWDKTRSLELLGKHLKLFVEKIEHSVSDDLARFIRDL